MSWISKLCETYDNNADKVLYAETTNDLLPISHTTQQAHIEVTLDAEGNFLGSEVLNQENNQTIIPVTEASATRTSGLEPHPLFDKLQYIAGDYKKYVNIKSETGYDAYIAKLTDWVSSPYSHEMVQAIHTYLLKKCLIDDLVSAKILYLDETGKIIEKWTGDDDKPAIFSFGINPSDAFVRFRVQIPGLNSSQVWNNPDVRQNFIEYYASKSNDVNLCYVTGKTAPVSCKSAGKIRHPGDMAKLISSNDTTGFTYRGRALSPSDAASLSYEASQKYVNALKWLIKKQAYRNEDQVIVSWGTKNEDIPDVISDADFLFGNIDASDKICDTQEEFAHRLNVKMAGYAAKLEPNSTIVVMGLDSTNGSKGRLSITFYRELAGSEFLKRIEQWHTTCCWYPLYYTEYEGNKKKDHYKIFGTPSPSDIALAAYGSKIDSKLKKATIERLLPCIIDGKQLPRDIVQQVVNRASNPVSMETWEWKKTISSACAIIRKHYNDLKNKKHDLNNYTEVWTVELNTNECDRSYLFGRLLAYARRIEEYALYVSKTEPRQTNAERFMMPFRKHPMKTWEELYLKLLPYLNRFRTSSPSSLGNRYEKEMNEVVSKLRDVQDGYTNESLSPLYLLGYQSQLNQFDSEIAEIREQREKEKKSEAQS